MKFHKLTLLALALSWACCSLAQTAYKGQLFINNEKLQFKEVFFGFNFA